MKTKWLRFKHNLARLVALNNINHMCTESMRSANILAYKTVDNKTGVKIFFFIPFEGKVHILGE